MHVPWLTNWRHLQVQEKVVGQSPEQHKAKAIGNEVKSKAKMKSAKGD
jgi:hypothetical protein